MSFEGDIVDCTVTSRKNRGMLPFERAIIVVFAMGELVLENRKSSDRRVGEKGNIHAVRDMILIIFCNNGIHLPFVSGSSQMCEHCTTASSIEMDWSVPASVMIETKGAETLS